ncbi:MAG: Dihydrofolate reductase region [Candidatus Roizmanbacteria bacterium GW2011_GWA2_33_33]|uniref:Dihydrofolate reductase region n=2 Tax=Candidatus Roizmaniibacteriota TaxID=1752723 RepID=A0A0G0B9V7_9BACT|nr:MAG: Dihydrofolate reductase region [Candidatus Roizmanbacteria bacterium GW2011_GWA2_33_33]KKP60561.1 MAG: Dihydrofolate reductase region [Candidatus Roizmanbacteria bacterium GW2011_GWC2_34_23]
MKVTMVMLSSIDGKTTQGNNKNVYVWSSKEDQRHFFSLIKKNNLIVMGRATYEASKPVIKLEKGKLRIILTRNPKKYSDQVVKDQLEFSGESPEKLLKQLSLLGYKEILLVGGSAINSLFLKQNLIDELYLTIEPKIFGSGKNITEGQLLDKCLQLISIKKLNKAGTLLLKYKINK